MLKSISGDDGMSVNSKTAVRRVRPVFAALIAVLIVINFFISYRNRAKFTSEEKIHRHDSDDVASANVDLPETEKIHEVSRARISVTGDVIIHNALLDSAKVSKNKYNFDYIYKYFKSYAEASDYAVTNLETTLGGADYTGYPVFNTPDSLLDSITGTGFDMLLTANNHANDTGFKGMSRTAKVLNERKIDFIGTVENKDDKRYLVKEINGIKIGMICYTYEGKARSGGRKALNGWMNNKSAAIINTFNERNLNEFYTELEQRLSAMKAEGAEATMVYLHWGEEYQLEPNSVQKKIAQKLCDMDVDVIVGGHPHVVQPMALLTSGTDSEHKTVCIYSMGNSVSNQRKNYMKLKTGHTEDGVFISYVFTKYSDGRVILSDVDLLPTWINMYYTKSRQIFEIIPLDKSVSDWKEAFSLDDARLKDANASYKRTMKIVGDGLTASQEYCRHNAGAIINQ